MTPFWMSEALRALLFGAAFLGTFVLAELVRRWKQPPVELTRKAVHILTGAGIATFPWVFQAWQTVALLSTLTTVLLFGTRVFGWLPSIHGVDRETTGDLLYPAAVGVLFFLAQGQPVLFVVPILTLAVADAMAALLGKAYGRMDYAVEKQKKTFEGSAAFFVSAFLTVHLPLLLMTKVDRTTSVLAAFQIAWMATCFEAICINGFDNFVVPLFTWFILAHLVDAYPQWMLLQLGSELGIAAGLLLLAWRSPLLSFAGALAMHLFLYGALSLGGSAWLSACMLGLGVLLAGLWRQRGNGLDEQRFQVLAVFYVTLSPLAVLLASHSDPWMVLDAKAQSLALALFCGILAGQLGCALSLLRSQAKRVAPRLGLALGLAALAWACMTPLALSVEGSLSAPALVLSLAAALALPLLTFIGAAWALRFWGPRLGWLRWQACAGLLIALLVWLA